MKKWISRAIGPVVLAVILIHLDLGAITAILRKASLGPLILAYLMFIPSLFFRTIRWRALMSPQGIHLGFWESFSAYAFSIFVGVATPGRLGEFTKALHLKRKGNSLGSSFFSVLMDRLFDIIFLLIFGCGALFSLFQFGTTTLKAMAWIFICVALGVMLLWFTTRGKGNKAGMRLLRAVSPRSLRSRVVTGYQDFSGGFRQTRPGILAEAFFLTTLAWGANYLAVYLFGRALGFGISFIVMACIAAVCALVALLPISVMGVGTRDAALILMLGKYGVSEAGAVAFSTLILSMLLFNAVICSFSLLTPVARFDWHSQMDGGPNNLIEYE